MTQKKGHISRAHAKTANKKTVRKARPKKTKANQVDKSTDPFETEIGPDVIVGATGADKAEETEVIQNGSSAENAEEENQSDRVEFPYSEMIRAYAPKTMKVMDRVVTDWKHEGSFMNLGIDNPYANMAVSLGLQKAKEVEKKLDEKGVLSAVRMGFEVLKQQVNKKK